jgi:nucleoside-diphosphate kinase
MERTLILIKPDAIQRERAGEIVSAIERKGLQIIGLKMVALTDEVLREHYSHIADKPFFVNIRNFMKSTPVIAMAVAGVDAVQTVRTMCGVTLARSAAPGTLRGSMAMSVQCNLVHASDSLEVAEVEIARFFSQSELFKYEKILDRVIYAPGEAS